MIMEGVKGVARLVQRKTMVSSSIFMIGLFNYFNYIIEVKQQTLNIILT